MMQIDTRLMEQVKDVLQQFGTKYITKDGSLKRNAVISDLDKYDKDLMVALLANNLIKDEYTEQIADTTVFKLRQLLVCNIPNFARLFVMTSASICACNPTKLRA